MAVLLEAKVDLEGVALPAHLTPLTGVNIYSNVDTWRVGRDDADDGVEMMPKTWGNQF